MPMLRAGELLRADDKVKVFGQWIPVGRSNAGHRVSRGGRFPEGWYRRDPLHHTIPIGMDTSGSMSTEDLNEALRQLSDLSTVEGIVLRDRNPRRVVRPLVRPQRAIQGPLNHRRNGKEPNELERCSGRCKYFFDGIDDCRNRECVHIDD